MRRLAFLLLDRLACIPLEESVCKSRSRRLKQILSTLAREESPEDSRLPSFKPSPFALVARISSEGAERSASLRDLPRGPEVSRRSLEGRHCEGWKDQLERRPEGSRICGYAANRERERERERERICSRRLSRDAGKRDGNYDERCRISAQDFFFVLRPARRLPSRLLLGHTLDYPA